MKISVVIPLYNEKDHICQVVNGLVRYKMPVVIVNDGSKDNSLQKIQRLKIPKLKILSHKINLGKGAAMLTGAEYAFKNRSDTVVFMDADGQHNPKDMKEFIKQIQLNKYDVILGSRNLSQNMPLIRYLGNKLASYTLNLFFGIKFTDPLSGYRAITKKVFEKIKWDSSGYSVESEILANIAKRNLKFIEIPIDTIYHDKDKGVTVLDAFGVLLDVLKWRLSP